MDWREAERARLDDVEATTIPRTFANAASRHGDEACQLYKGGARDRSLVAEGVVPAAPDGEYAELRYDEVDDLVRTLAAGFRELGVSADDRVAIYADTRMEWAGADLALQTAGAVVTTAYTQSSPDRLRYLLSDPGASGVVVGSADLLETLLAVEDDLDLSFVVALDEVGDEHTDRDDLHTLGDVYALGEEGHDPDAVESWLDARDPDDLSSVVYTSGTTGDPKGVMLTHRNFHANAEQLRARLGPRPDRSPDVPTLDPGDVGFALLPLAHSFERVFHYLRFASGAATAYAESPATVGEDLRAVRPHGAAAVPRVYERLFRAVRESAGESSLRRRAFEWAVDVGLAHDRADDPGALLSAERRIADRLAFSSVRDALGGRIELFVSGGGSLSPELARIYRAMGVPIAEGYGLTETSPALTLNPPEDVRPGTIGPALPGVELSVDPSAADAALAEDAEGEVGELLVRGPNVFEGYWGKPDLTEEAFTDDGRFRTGDVVAIGEDGYVTFLDRVKNLLVLDTGENVAPEPIEDEFATSDRIEQVMLVGDDEKFVAALVVPDVAALRSWAESEGIDLAEEPVDDPRVREWVGEEVERINGRLDAHERIGEFRLVAEAWTPENGLLTPSMKKRRPAIREAHADAIAGMFDRDADGE